jgi:hypothetical protein
MIKWTKKKTEHNEYLDINEEYLLDNPFQKHQYIYIFHLELVEEGFIDLYKGIDNVSLGS